MTKTLDELKQEAKELGILTDIYDFSSDMPWIWNVAKFAK